MKRYSDLTTVNKSYHGMLMLGKVMDNRDPQKRGRVQVFIEPLHGILTDFEVVGGYDGLPWAMPISPLFGGGTGTEATPSNNNWGLYAVPRIGDNVVMMPLMDNQSALCYFGSLSSLYTQLPEIPDTAGTTDPSTYEMRLHNGHRVVFRTTVDSEIMVQTENGHYIKIDDINSIIQAKVGNATVTMHDAVDINATIGNASVVMTDGTNITANIGNSTIVMDSGGTIHLN